MQGLHIAYKLHALHIQVVGLAAVLLCIGLGCCLQCPLYLLQEVALVHLVGMQFHAEGAHAYLLQARLHHLQRCPLLCHEKHALTLIHGIGDKIGDGLRLARTRRAVQNEGAPLAGLHHRFHLRRVGIHRQSVCIGACVHVQFAGIYLRCAVLHQQPAVYEAAHDVAAQHGGAVGVQVVPHYKLGERENAYHRLLCHLPCGMLLHRLA